MQLITDPRGVQVGLKCVRLEGSMSMDARDKMIHAFTTDPDVKVLSPRPISSLHPPSAASFIGIIAQARKQAGLGNGCCWRWPLAELG